MSGDGYRNRYRRRQHRPANELSAAYVRCGLPEDWDDRPVEHDYLSTRSGNRLYRAQVNAIRRLARFQKHKVCKTFCDLEPGGPTGLAGRDGLARLLVEARSRGFRILLVERAGRLDDDPLLVALLLDHLGSLGVSAFAASPPAELTNDPGLEGTLAGADAEALTRARKTLGLLKQKATRMQNRTRDGRRPFGAQDVERRTLDRIRALCRVLPRDRWVTRGGRIMIRRPYREIAEILDAEGLGTRTGRPWAAGTVRGIIDREWPALVRHWSRPIKPKRRR
jgi:hypothetical protein